MWLVNDLTIESNINNKGEIIVNGMEGSSVSFLLVHTSGPRKWRTVGMDGECSMGHPKGPARENHINTQITIGIRKGRALQAFGREKANDEGLAAKSQQSCSRPKSRDHA